MDKAFAVFGRDPEGAGVGDPSRDLNFQHELAEVWGWGDLGSKMLTEYLGRSLSPSNMYLGGRMGWFFKVRTLNSDRSGVEYQLFLE